MHCEAQPSPSTLIPLGDLLGDQLGQGGVGVPREDHNVPATDPRVHDGRVERQVWNSRGGLLESDDYAVMLRFRPNEDDNFPRKLAAGYITASDNIWVRSSMIETILACFVLWAC